MENDLLTLKDIYIGSTDAKNELLYGDTCEIEQFKKNFIIPPSLLIESFETRKKYFITGLKGTGKTALLRYIDIQMNDKNNISSFILFKSDIDDELKKKISQISRIEIYENNSTEYDDTDFEIAWRWFIYKLILLNSYKREIFFEKNTNFQKFKALIDSTNQDIDNTSSIFNMFPKIKKGMLSINIKELVKIGVDIEFGKKNEVKFYSLVRQLDEAFTGLKILHGRMNLFFDELELNYNTSKQYQKDARLIRDLIVSIEKINAVTKKNKIDISIYAGIRSEVLNAVEALGKEINKPLSDFGVEILWNRPGVTAIQQPLLSIIEQRINNARNRLFLPEMNSEELWKTYFPNFILSKEPYIYILRNSWYRPRDIIRLLKIAQEQFPDSTSFSSSVFEPIRKKYSFESWVEMSEELKAKYSSNYIDSIKKIFYGKKQIWEFIELKSDIFNMADNYPHIKELINRFSIDEILSDLYRVGIIGNIDRTKSPSRMRFVFRGDAEILFYQEIYLHNALLAHLSI